MLAIFIVSTIDVFELSQLCVVKRAQATAVQQVAFSGCEEIPELAIPYRQLHPLSCSAAKRRGRHTANSGRDDGSRIWDGTHALIPVKPDFHVARGGPRGPLRELFAISPSFSAGRPLGAVGRSGLRDGIRIVTLSGVGHVQPCTAGRSGQMQS